MRSFWIWAHRGASSEAPENTLAAFLAAEKAGAQGIELDIHLTRDGVPVVIHDVRVDRTTDGSGPVSRLTLAELRRLDAGSWFAPDFAGEPIPTLEEVLAWAGDRLRLNLEIKDAGTRQAILPLLARYPAARVLISSFDYRLLAAFRRADGGLPLGVLLESAFWGRALRLAVAIGAESLHPREDRVSRPLLTQCRRLGLKVYPWTVDDPGQALRFSFLGVDGIFSNNPRLLQAAGGRCRVLKSSGNFPR
jgi:glycerophosphoryl diester phosphodiesterase